MSRALHHAYLKVPAGLDPLPLITEACALLRTQDPFGRIQYQRGESWICPPGGGVASLRDTRRIAAFQLLTQKLVDEVVVVGGYSNTLDGSYGHFVEGTLVRFLADGADWQESRGAPEPWEQDLIRPGEEFSFSTMLTLAERLNLPGCADPRATWEIDLAVG